MALQYVSVITVYVSDQDKALDFYTNKLGFTKTTDAEFGEGMRWVEVKTPEGNATLMLHMASEDYMKAKLGQWTGLVFYSDDVRGTCEDLKAKGVNITEEPHEQPWGVHALFTDQDGNGYTVVGG